MKCALLACLTLLSVTTFAQQAEDIKPAPKPFFLKKNEIGVMAETSYDDNNNGNTNFVGLQYKHWVKPYMGFRVIASYAQYEDNGRAFFSNKVGDTVFELSSRTTIPMVYVGAGIEMQRQFYKRVYLFAAVEARAGYGSGWSNPNITKKVQNNTIDYMSQEPNGAEQKGATMFSVEASPTIGAKLQFRHLVIGTELSFIHMRYRHLSNVPYTYNGSNGEFSAGDVTERFFIHYRF